ncbi:MAG: SPOR domain-containing protein [Treponema sp.]|jgi:hypothetical protein|nr:SPOR domain-containing protein [Treponema sp.]
MMKNYVIKTAKPAVLGVVFLLLFASLSGASVWEGAAAVSSGGEFPDSGFYVATNSFPRNTVVDITNLETGKTVRGIVAANLDSPGLLAIISKECAEAVGLQSRSIGRIRMIQPADPIAFSRFGEENLASGDPDYDPEAALKAYGQSPDSAKAEPETGTQIAEPPVAAIPHRPGKMSGDEDTEETPADGVEKAPLEDDAAEAAIVAVPVQDPVPAEVPVTDPAQPPETADEKAEIAEYTEPEPAGAVVITAIPEETPPEEAETILADTVPEESVPEPAYPEESVWYSPPEEGSVFTLIPAEERPPVVGETVPEITAPHPAEELPASREEPAVRAVYVPGAFSVPSVNELEPGRYYLQLGAYSKTDAVEQEITKIEKNLPLAVQCIGSTDKPIYRILVGPVNHGESGALLQRFRGRGYKDAFVRRGE